MSVDPLADAAAYDDPIKSALSACATPDPPPTFGWSHPTANQRIFMKDRYVCLQKARHGRTTGFVSSTYGIGTSSRSAVMNGGLPVACMGAKGYTIGPNGELVTPSKSMPVRRLVTL
jgi:hypothetical protein